MAHVFRPHVTNDRNARFASQQRAVADLDSQALVRAMQHRLAMKTDHVDLVRLQALFVKEIMNSNGMEQCQVMLSCRSRPGRSALSLMARASTSPAFSRARKPSE